MKSYYYQEVETKQGYRYKFVLQDFDLPEFEWSLGQESNFRCYNKEQILKAKQYKALNQYEARHAWFYQENESGYSSKWKYWIFDYIS